MRLLAKYNRVNIITTIVVMLITGIVYYQAISRILVNQVDKDLKVEENEALDYVRVNHKLPEEFESKDQQIYFSPAPTGSVERRFLDTNYVKDKHESHESGRALLSSVTANGVYYKLYIVESKVETEDLIQLIFAITIGLILLLMIVLLLINRLVLNRLWAPFYSILKELKSFSVADTKEIPGLDTRIDEFNELNQEVAAMAGRVKNDYKNLKTFTENASHELLTPIAVINSKLDTLIQTDSFTKPQSKLLDDLYIGVSRLNRLNRALLLLVKLENNLETDQKPVNLKELIEEMLSQFEEIFNDKALSLSYELADKEIYANSNLLEVLISNLLYNAIRHNHQGGNITVILTADGLTVKNTGEDSSLEAAKIFSRFHKSSRSEGSGLGLTICRQICENMNFKLNYSFTPPEHIFTITF